MVPVRTLLVVLSMLACQSVAAAADRAKPGSGSGGVAGEVVRGGDQEASSGILVMSRVELHSGGNDLAKACRAPYAVAGCTDFPVERLDCRCELRGDGWGIVATASIEAVIHLPNTSGYARLRRHEELHIEDVKTGLARHLATIEERRFDVRESCDHYATFLSTSAHLRVVMNELRVESNEKFGCSRPQRSARGH